MSRRSSWCSLRALGPVRRCALLLRSGLRCSWCGVELTQATAEIDHVVPRARGGATVNTNLAASCGDCNATRGARLPEVPPELSTVLAAPVDLAAGRALALAWYPWAAERFARRRKPRPAPAETPEAIKKRRQRQRAREAREQAVLEGLGGVAFPFGGSAP